MPRSGPTFALSDLLLVFSSTNRCKFDMYQLVPQEISPYLFAQLPGKLQQWRGGRIPFDTGRVSKSLCCGWPISYMALVDLSLGAANAWDRFLVDIGV